jgi:2'-5' RNA ligase
LRRVPSLRLFVAAELPAEAVDALVAWRPRDDGLRPVAPEALHVTMAFLGAREEGDVPVIEAALEGAARPVRALSLGAPLWLPKRRPRVLAVDLGDADGALAALQADVARRLQEGIGWTPERRAFLAHVTVARVRAGARDVPAVEPPEPLGPFAATAVTLFRSHLSPRGARYEALARAPLEP